MNPDFLRLLSSFSVNGHVDEVEEEEEEDLIKLRKVHVRFIPSYASSQMVSALLDSQVGLGSVVSCELRPSLGRKTTALVSFQSSHHAVRAISLSKQGGFILDGSKIGVFGSAHQVSARRRRNPHEPLGFKGTVLEMGCLKNHDTFYELCAYSNCDVELNKKSKSISITIPQLRNGNSVTFKLQWYLGDLHETRWCKARRDGVTTSNAYECLMLRVWKAPQVFWLADITQDNEPLWGRTKDFTSEASIGQSFVYCLRFPDGNRGRFDLVTNIEKKHLIVTSGPRYSSSIEIAPVLHPSIIIIGLPFPILFLLNSLVQEGYLSGPGLRMTFYHMLRPSREVPTDHVCHILNLLRREQDTCFNPEQWYSTQLGKFRMQSHESIRRLTGQPHDDGLMLVRKVFVTPTRVYFTGPEIELSNRVTRHFREYIDDFLRVTFVDENFGVLPSSALVVPRRRGLSNGSPQHTNLYDRVKHVLNHSITIGSKKFEFLAFSSSQLRENSAWMFSSSASISADEIRKWMGDFLGIRNVAKCASRMGQSFSSSTKSLDVPRSDTEEIPDIWNASRTYRFSDGIGKISEEFAMKVARKCKLKEQGKAPSLYQIRYGGYKGVVAVDPTSTRKLSFRPSMNKFPSQQISLDILNWSRRIPCYLNREIITLLSTLGLVSEVFERMQNLVVEQLLGMLSNVELAVEVLETFSGGARNQEMIALLEAGFHPDREPFLRSMLNAFRAVQLMGIRKKARIFVPKGRLLMGCMDETAKLEYGEVFISVTPTPGQHRSNFSDGLRTRVVYGINRYPQNVCIVEGKVIVAKNPCVHPGDVRVLRAVNVPSLHHLVDCIVFPQKGPRSHPSECSGSDLDGDLYFVSWDPNLIPDQVDEPQDYQPSPQEKLDRPVTTEDIVGYFAEFMVNNSLGLLSNAHVVFADLEPLNARSAPCLRLARLCSQAVDFPKTGVAAALPPELRPTAYPDFMEKRDKPEYESKKVLGKLFRNLGDEFVPEKFTFTRREASAYYDRELEYEGYEYYLEEACADKCCYDEKLLDLMHLYDVKSEAEIFTGNILQLSKWYKKRPGEVKERIKKAMTSLRKEARSWLRGNTGDGDDGDDDDDDGGEAEAEELARASAWYHVTYHPRYVPQQGEEHLLSFPWVVYDKLAQIKKLSRRRRRRQGAAGDVD